MSQSDSSKATATPRRKSGFSLNFSILAALVFALLISGWMLSGEIVIGGSDHDQVPPIANKDLTGGGKNTTVTDAKLFRVSIGHFKATKRDEILHVRARTEAEASVEVRAETAGRILSIGAPKGALVEKGDVLCKLDEGSRKASLEGAKAQLEQARSDYMGSKKLARQGYSAELAVSTKRAAFDAATAALEQAELDLANTSIKAPFTGVIENRPTKIGDFLAVGATCTRLVRLDPLLVVGEVSERNIGKLKTGQTGRAELVTGEKVPGKIRFISQSAIAATRTFRIELEVDNKDRKLRDGVTADIYLPLQAENGHYISPALLTLNDAGEIGVRIVEAGNIVRFKPVNILDQSQTGVWVSGLPDEVDIITAGQDYVTDGQKVEAVAQRPGSLGGGEDGRS